MSATQNLARNGVRGGRSASNIHRRHFPEPDFQPLVQIHLVWCPLFVGLGGSLSQSLMACRKGLPRHSDLLPPLDEFRMVGNSET